MKKKVAIAKSGKKRGPFFETPLVKFLNARIGSRPKMTATEVADQGGLSQSYLSELKNGWKDPKGIGAEALYRLATGMDESPLTILYLANELPTTRLDDHVLEQILKDYAKLDEPARERNEYLIKQLRRVVKDELRNA